MDPLPVAVADDAAFIRYPETSELLERMGMPLLPESLADAPLPAEACGVILPGGFGAACRRAECLPVQPDVPGLPQRPVYAECGGMLLLGRTLEDLDGKAHAMADVLPFNAGRGRLRVGYRTLQPHQDGVVTRAGDTLRGPEFHRWSLAWEPVLPPERSLWEIHGWRTEQRHEGWSHQMLHANWVHLHWASSTTICSRWRAARNRSASWTDATSNARPRDCRPMPNAGN